MLDKQGFSVPEAGLGKLCWQRTCTARSSYKHTQRVYNDVSKAVNIRAFSAASMPTYNTWWHKRLHNIDNGATSWLQCWWWTSTLEHPKTFGVWNGFGQSLLKFLLAAVVTQQQGIETGVCCRQPGEEKNIVAREVTMMIGKKERHCGELIWVEVGGA